MRTGFALWLPAGLCALLLAGCLVFAVTVVPGVRDHPGYSGLLDEWLGNGLYALAAVVVGLRALLRRKDRLAWTVLALGIASYTAGNIYYFTAQRSLPVVPIPSLADVLWLAFYPCAYVFIVLQLRREVRHFQPSVWLDGAIAALGAAALGAAFVLGAVQTDTSGSAATVITNMSYPLGDLVLVTLIVASFGLFGWRPAPLWWLAGIGMAGFAIADAVYLLEASRGTYRPGSWLDLMWDLGLALLAVAAVIPNRKIAAGAMTGWPVLVVPSLFTLSSVGLLAVSSRVPVPMSAIILATLTALLAVMRTWLTFRDVRQLADTRRLARTDDLTGLPNRRHFHSAVASATRGSGSAPTAVLLMDLDRFKEINDTLGHHVGDDLLTRIGSRLSAALYEGDILARLGGDEFGFLLHDTNTHDAVAAASRILSVLREPFDLVGVSLHIDASIGIAVCPEHADSVTALLQRADVAMYRAKAAHTGYEVSRPHVDAADSLRLKTLEQLRTALDNDELLLHYQPKQNLATGAIVGVEALLRWQHPTRGLLYPDTFLPLAEQSGLMRRLTMRVLEIALRQAAQWQRDGLELTVAVNLSSSNLLDTQLPGQIELLLDTLGVQPKLLELEITETVLMADPARARQVLNDLRKRGIRIAVDDYGTGYSSLAYLQDLPVDDLKLDQSFVMRSTSDPRSAAIVRSTIALAHALDMTIIAEGVEDEVTLAQLSTAGCDIAQGYYIARPQPPTEFLVWLSARIPAPRGSLSPSPRRELRT